MTYDEKIPEFALRPAKAADENQDQIDDGFDPTPYDRLLATAPEIEEEASVEAAVPAVEDVIEEAAEVEIAAEAEEAEAEETDVETVEVKGEEPKELPTSAPQNNNSQKSENPVMPPEPLKITPIASAAIYNDMKITTVVQKQETRIFIEEDILVPDIKPDLVSILSMEGTPILSNKEIQIGQGEEDSVRIAGEIALQTIYLPEQKDNKEIIAIIPSRLPFKTDWQGNVSPMSHLTILPEIEQVEYTVINERKFRAKITLKLELKEYAQKELQIFENIKGEDLQLLKEKVKISHVALRKEDSVEISEGLKVKDGGARPVKILTYDVNIIENHKQITSEKMVINATIWSNILYLGEEETDSEAQPEPALLQTKTDFTQFILIDKEENSSGIKVSFNKKGLSIKLDEDDLENDFKLEGSVNTSIEVYQTIEKEVVSDLYHGSKETTYDYNEKMAEAIIGSGTTEVSSREIFNVPEKHGTAEKVIYISGRVKESSSTVEQGRNLVEGVLEGKILCLAEGEEKTPFVITQELPFRGSIEIPSAEEGMKAETQIGIRDLWFDKINGKQVEVNASLLMETTVLEEKPLRLIKNPCFIESAQTKRPAPMVVYITKRDDTLWKIAKQYKTTRTVIRQINDLGENQKLDEGMRLLIVK